MGHIQSIVENLGVAHQPRWPDHEVAWPPAPDHNEVVRIEEQRRVTRELLEMLQGSRPNGVGQPFEHGVDAYVSRSFAELEERLIFAQQPQMVALSCELAEPGAVLTDEVGPAPVVVVRGRDGVARAFLNVCRHRSAPVELERCATRHSLMCPYHGWTYGLDGELRAISDPGGFEGLEPGDRGLVQLPVLEIGGMIFVHPQPGGAFEEDGRSELAEQLGGYGLETLHRWRSEEFTYDFNWKLGLETFHETYHFAWLHATTVGTLLHGNRSHYTGWGRHHRMAIPRRSIDALAEQHEDDWVPLDHLVVVQQVFPNSLVIWLKDHVETWRAYPDPTDPGRCRIRLTLFTPTAPADEREEAHWELNWKLTMDTVDNEDFRLAAGIQRGMASGAQDAVVYGSNEPALQHFARTIRHAVGQSSA